MQIYHLNLNMGRKTKEIFTVFKGIFMGDIFRRCALKYLCIRRAGITINMIECIAGHGGGG